MNLSNKPAINADQLKLIAIIAMVIDHCAVVFLPESSPAMWPLRMIGRMTAPIMCFLIAEGYHHTSNLKKYMGRLLFMAVVSHVPHNLCLGMDVFPLWKATSVMLSLFCGLAALAVWKSRRIPARWQKVLLIVLCCLLAYSADWNYIAVLWILGFGVFHGSFRKQLLTFCCVAVLYMMQPLVYNHCLPSVSRLGIFFVIPLLFFYNGQRGLRHKQLIKWGFYWFYPLHLLILYGLDQLL